MKTLILVFISSTSIYGQAQLSGYVTDNHKEPLINATVQVYREGFLRSSSITDFDGNYVVSPLEPGSYYIVISHLGFDSLFCNMRISDLPVKFNPWLTLIRGISDPIVVTVYCPIPFFDLYNPTKTTITRDKIEHMPIR